MDDVIFRQAEAADLADIVALLADDPIGRLRETVSDPLDRRYETAFEAIGRDPNQLLAVAMDAGRLVGFMQISFIPGLSRTGMWRGQIEGVRIAADRRGTGLGRQFFEWAFDRLRERGCALVQLTSDKSRSDAMQFYERLGFTASHEGLKKPL
jgi:ribosomal protein S18 acetylase RimI-like enzyme